MTDVTSKLKQLTVENPMGQSPDPWADFREIEILGLEWTQNYKHSLGKYSRFFLELENGRFLATTCSNCGDVWAPPRPVCPTCLQITQWTDLPGTGRLISWSVLHYAPKMLADRLQTPYVLAYVALDGATTLFAHLLNNFGSLTQLEYGLPVKIVYTEGSVDHPIMLMSFEPVTQK